MFHILYFFACSTMFPSGSIPLKETAFKADTDIDLNYFGAGWTTTFTSKKLLNFLLISDLLDTQLSDTRIFMVIMTSSTLNVPMSSELQ